MEPRFATPLEEQLYKTLTQLRHECAQAGFETARDYNWPKAMADAETALRAARGEAA